MKIVNTARNFNIDGCDAIDRMRKAGHEVIDYGDIVFESDEARLKAVEDADVVIPAVEEMQADFLAKCKNLKLISVRGIGYDNVDVEYCNKHDIAVARALGTVEAAVAEQAMAYIMYFARRIDLQNKHMQNGEWKRIMMPGAKTKVLGLVGFGGIGKEIAKRGAACGMEIVYYCRNPRDEWTEEYGAKYMPLDELLQCSDYVSINLPLTNETRGMFSKEMIGKMKQGSVLINIARGAIVDNEALRDAVMNGHLAGAGVDVFEAEPCTDSVLMGVDGIALTPHTAPFTHETFVSMNNLTAQNVIDFANGSIDSKYIVNK